MFRFGLTLFIVFSLFVSSLNGAAPPADKIFPDATKGFVSIQNLQHFIEQWEQTSWGKLLNDPLMSVFQKEVQKRLTERMEQTFGIRLDGFTSLPSGETAVGMIAIPQQVPGYVLTMDVSGQRTEADNYLADLTQKLAVVGVTRAVEPYNGHTITSLTFPAPKVQTPRPLGNTRIEIAVEPIERKAYYMFVHDVFLASDQLALLKLFADRLAGSSGRSLSDVEAYQVTMRRCIADVPNQIQPVVRWYVEPLDYGESVRTLLRGPVVQNRREKPSIFSILKQQGFDAVQGIGGVITMQTEEQASVSRTFIYTKKPYRSAMRMLAFSEEVTQGGANYVPPVWIPGDLARTSMFNVDAMTIFDNIGSLADAFLDEEGVWNDILVGLRTDPYGPRINIRDEIIAHLGSRLLGLTRHTNPITPGGSSLLVAAELKPGREPAMLSAMEKLFGNDPEMQATQYKSHKIWHRKPGGAQSNINHSTPNWVDFVLVSQRSILDDGDGSEPFFPNGAVAAAGGYLFVASDAAFLKTILDRTDTPAESAVSALSQQGDYREVHQILSGMAPSHRAPFFQVFGRAHETIRPKSERFRKGELAQSESLTGKLVSAVFVPDAGSGTDRLDGSALPEFEKIQHYFGKGGILGVAEPEGYFIKGFTVGR